MKTFCGYFNQGICRSCDLITLEYRDQIQQKEQALEQVLKNVSHPVFLTTISSPPQNFRNKAKFVVTGSLANPIIGLWGESELDLGRELLACPLHLPEINMCLQVLKEFIPICHLSPYSVAEQKGELKGIIIFHSDITQETYLRLVLRSKEAITRIIKFHNILLEKIPSLKMISANIQPTPHAILEGEEEVFITEKKNIKHEWGNLSPKAFVQTNQSVARKLYQTAADWVNFLQVDKFLELYCGQGAFSFNCAPYIKHGLGIEINEAAIAEANLTAQKLNLTQLKFECQDAGKVESEMKLFNPAVILVNPPRRGLTETVNLLLKQGPPYIIYSSCGFETLAKDLEKLSQHYIVEKIQIFDMFPHTRHFETLVQLKKISTKVY